MDENNSSNSFDYIIIGGGSAGCAIANRLVSNNKDKVLLIEAGQKKPSLIKNSYKFRAFY